MYRTYNSLQRKQLSEQEYVDSQGVGLLIYAPVRCNLVKASLKTQLHARFTITGHLGQTLSPLVDGVVLVCEDAEWMSMTLSRFAEGLAAGAELVFSDAVFGYEGNTSCYYPDDNLLGCRCAAVSRALLERIRPLVSDPTDPRQLIWAAMKHAKTHRHIPEVLLHYRHSVRADDLFGPTGKRVLILSHVLDMTGAPIVLVNAVPVLRKLGYEVVVLGPSAKESMPLFLAEGATVLVSPDCVSSPTLLDLALESDLVIANTVVECLAIGALSNAPVPVLWWLHDAFMGYPGIAHRIPMNVGDNIRIVAVGKHAAAAMHSTRPHFPIEQLIYGLPDYAQDSFEHFDISFSGGKPLFVNVGAFEPRKGQDIFVKAIRLLPIDVRKKAAFLFIGKGIDKTLYKKVENLTLDYPENVFYRRLLTRGEIKSLMSQATCVVCSSTDDPMPTFVTEGLIFGRPAIVSEHTGTAGVLTEGVNGFVYHNNDPKELAARLEYAIEHPKQLEAMRPACRKLYEDEYSQQAFADNLAHYVHEMVQELD